MRLNVRLASFGEYHVQRKQIAETTTLAEHVKVQTKPSVLVPGLTVTAPDVFVCPKCKREHENPRHGDLFVCEGCDTLYEVYGNSLGIG